MTDFKKLVNAALKEQLAEQGNPPDSTNHTSYWDLKRTEKGNKE